MHAITCSEPGGPDVLCWSEVPDPPPPGPGEVTIGVVAAGVNRADLLQRQGFYAPPPGASDVIGMECSGTVIDIHDSLEGWGVGDEVCALLAGGGYAEKVVVPADQLLPAPDGVSLVEAAGLPETVCTVWLNLIRHGELADGETVLIHGGASGIGTTAIQLVRALRPACRIFVTAGTPEKLELCRKLGADVAISYRDEDFVARVRAETDGRGADVILDNMGATYLERNVDLLATSGRLMVIGLQGGRKGTLDLALLLAKRGTVYASSLRARPAAEKAEIVAGVLRDVWPAVEQGRIRPVVDRVLPVSSAADAHALVEGYGHAGKVILQVIG